VDLNDYVNPYYKKIRIPNGHVWLSGDNKHNSLDSRYSCGCVSIFVNVSVDASVIIRVIY
jgi:hypothetical protein